MAERGKPIPVEVRNAIARHLGAGTSYRSTARAAGVAVNTVRKYRVHRITRRRASEAALGEIVRAWPTLPEVVRLELLRIVRE